MRLTSTSRVRWKEAGKVGSFSQRGGKIDFVTGMSACDPRQRPTEEDTPRPKRVALVGVGGHGEAHLAAMKPLEAEGLLNLVAVADPFRDRLAEVATELEARGVRWNSDHREMFSKEPDLDLVVFCTPIPFHANMISDAIAMTPARILMDKPAVPALSQLERLIAEDRHERVRIGYQMIYWPAVQRLKKWVAHRSHGGIESIVVAAGWPRPDAYYARAGWAGKLTQEGLPVFDGPATNALSHLLHNVCYFLGGEGRPFATPERVRATLSRAREIESYDTAEILADFQGVSVKLLMSHAVHPHVPFRIWVQGKRAAAGITEGPSGLMCIGELAGEELPPGTSDKDLMYRAFAGPPDIFAAMPSTLRDCRAVTFWTNAALVSSGGIHTIPPGSVSREPHEIVNICGLAAAIETFPEPSPGFVPPWPPPGPSIGESEVSAADEYFRK